MKHWLLVVAIICFGSPAFARDNAPCDGSFAVESRALNTTTAYELFNADNSSGTFKRARRLVCIQNQDSTAANHVWVSSFPVTTLVSGVLDTAKSLGIPGGNVADATLCLPLGLGVRVFVHRVIGSGRVAGFVCD